MRPWYKYELGQADSAGTLPVDKDFSEHVRSMGGVDSDEAYLNPRLFFEKYFFGFQSGRLEAYARFVEKHVPAQRRILSVGSGRCATETYLNEKGYRITCSDLGSSAGTAKLQELFPSFRFQTLDFMADPLPEGTNGLLIFSMLYLFGAADLGKFFARAAQLPPGGDLIVDAAAAPDNGLTWLLDEVVLRAEASARSLLKGRGRKVVRKQHGYRFRDADIVGAAREHGFTLLNRAAGGELTEFQRSSLFNALVPGWAPWQAPFRWLGKLVPYVRLFHFQRAG